MNMDEARRLIQTQDTSDIERSCEAIATVLRFYGLADPRLLKIADLVEKGGQP